MDYHVEVAVVRDGVMAGRELESDAAGGSPPQSGAVQVRANGTQRGERRQIAVRGRAVCAESLGREDLFNSGGRQGHREPLRSKAATYPDRELPIGRSRPPNDNPRRPGPG